MKAICINDKPLMENGKVAKNDKNKVIKGRQYNISEPFENDSKQVVVYVKETGTTKLARRFVPVDDTWVDDTLNEIIKSANKTESVC